MIQLVIADLHTHTVGSTHAYGTVMENAKAAKEKGLKVIAITDHGPKMEGGPDWYYFQNLKVLPDYICGVRILRSVEANILDEKGTLDLPDRALLALEFVTAGVHNTVNKIVPKKGEEVEWYTQCTVEAIKGPHVDVITHPGNSYMPVDPEELVNWATREGRALEINDNSFVARPGSEKACREIARLCAKHNTWVSVASDAHSPFSVGVVDTAWALAMECGIKSERIINSSMSSLNAFLKERGRDTVL